MSVRAVVAAGSNVGDREGTLNRGFALLAVHPQVTVAALSPVYETDPVGGPAQEDFLNVVALVDTDLDPLPLLGLLHVIEAACGRERREHWGPRTLDLDLVAFGELTSTDARCTLPHPRAHERAFVLTPWAALDPAAQLVGWGSVAELLRGLDASGVRERPDLEVTV
ncbi:MAG: dihydroneopterin aldolase / 2-amino-4-hydroxy-6-hydroxymethyldihydropteridine diphosphokinase [Frankiaceae bacterium]|nr:dihydroneopterin aldolase / 2-amino-4-hydroxy-6-hydroxymethyldihydropteridine diphosphokinase [Frankiaceae bacterium]